MNDFRVTADNIQLLAGNVDRKKQDWVTAKVGQITMHEDYNPKRYINDIAILEVIQSTSDKILYRFQGLTDS